MTNRISFLRVLTNTTTFIQMLIGFVVLSSYNVLMVHGSTNVSTWDQAYDSLDGCLLTMAQCRDETNVIMAGLVDQQSCENAGFTWTRTYATWNTFKTDSVNQENAWTSNFLSGTYLVKLVDGLTKSSFESKFGSDVTFGDYIYCWDGAAWAYVSGVKSNIESYKNGAFEFILAVTNSLKLSPYTIQYNISNTEGRTSRRVRLSPSYVGRARDVITSWKAKHETRRLLRQNDESFNFDFDVHIDFPHNEKRRALEESDEILQSMDELIISTTGAPSSLDWIVEQPEAIFIEPVFEMKINNLDAMYITQSGTNVLGNVRVRDDNLSPLLKAGVDGSTEIVGVADTGVDENHCFFSDPGVTVNPRTQGTVFTNTSRRKVVQYASFADGAEGEVGGHGTHVCGSIVGFDAGLSVSNDFRGMAPGAKLAFFDIGLPNNNAVFPPSNLATTLFPFPFSVGARIHSNSWGGNANVYSTDSRNVDLFSFSNQEFLVLFANGNAGRVTGGSVGTPATAKNCLSVGASMNADRHFNSLGQSCPSNASPNNCPNNLASFSSNGPSSDGRIKPDVVAPGQTIGSSRSGTTCGLVLLQGTSMATPVTAGNAALVRQFIKEGRFVNGNINQNAGFSPMGALVKAVLINGAQLLSGSYGAVTLSSAKPGNEQGFGRIKLSNNMLVAGNTGAQFVFLDGNVSSPRLISRTGSRVTYRAPLLAGTGVDLKVTLVWHDPPASVNSLRNLVNDLDLTVTDPQGKVFFPNGRTSRDNTNNVEHTVISGGSIITGDYIIQVSGRAVNQGPQPFALVLTGPVNRGQKSDDGYIGDVTDEDDDTSNLFEDGDNNNNNNNNNQNESSGNVGLIVGAVIGGIVLSIGMFAIVRSKRNSYLSNQNSTNQPQMTYQFNGSQFMDRMSALGRNITSKIYGNPQQDQPKQLSVMPQSGQNFNNQSQYNNYNNNYNNYNRNYGPPRSSNLNV